MLLGDVVCMSGGYETYAPQYKLGILVVSHLVPDALEAPVRSVGWLRKDVHKSAMGIADVGLAGPLN